MTYTAPLYYSILFSSQYLLHYMAQFKIAIENASFPMRHFQCGKFTHGFSNDFP